jgi:predicted negative regulator of RcsB-dependent stress response
VDELLTDQQQAERVKTWLGQNGGAVLAGLALGLGGLFGWNYWQGYQQEQAELASATYEQLLESVRSQRVVRAAELELELSQAFSGSPYVDQARLALARLHMDRNENDEAERYLSMVGDDPTSAEIGQLARLRLARVQLHREQYDAALASLADIDENSAYAPRYHEVRGDVHAALGDIDQARVEYETALAATEPGVLNRPYVQVKLDNLEPVVEASTAMEAASAEPEPPAPQPEPAVPAAE